jgi:hypothetical protein
MLAMVGRAVMAEATVGVPTKIGVVHLGRDAYVYVRQSTLTQVQHHTESLARQYELGGFKERSQHPD